MKDSTLYKILGVIILIFLIFFAWKVFIFPKTVQASEANKQEESIKQVEKQATNSFVENQLSENDEKNEVQTSQATNVFNNQLDRYKGTQKGADIRSLLESVRNSNLVEDENKISIEYNGEIYLTNIYDLKNEIETSKTYEVCFEYRKNTKYIEKIVIEQK